MLPTATVSGTTRAYVREGTDLVAGSLTVRAGTAADRVVYEAEATSFVISVGIASGSGANAAALVIGTVEAFIGAPVGTAPGGIALTILDVTGLVDIDAASSMTATAKADGGGGGAISVTAMLPSAEAGGTTRAYVGQGADIDATTLDIDADGTYFAEATTIAVAIGGLAGGVGADADARVTGIVDAHVGASAGTAVTAPTVVTLTGDLTIDAIGDIYAHAKADGGSGGAITGRGDGSDR